MDKLIKELRQQRQMSQVSLAKWCECSQSMIAEIENGKRTPSPKLAKKFAIIFNLSIEEIWKMFYDDSDTA